MIGIKPRTLLLGHTSPETAYVVEDYPYGFRLRCKIRYWIETAEKGARKGQQRFMTQTTNPKVPGEVWNKPKGSTYVALAFLYLDDEGHVQWTGVSPYGLTPEVVDRYRLTGVTAQMPEVDRRFYDFAVKLSQKSRSWGEWAEKVTAYAETIKATGEPPALVNGTFLSLSGTLRYIGEENHELAIAVAREQLAAEA